MKRLLLVGTAVLALAASEVTARDPSHPVTPIERVSITYTGKLVTFEVPKTGLYQIVAFGAQGGSGAFAGFVGPGGRGAEIGGDFSLTAGEILQIAVGGRGADLSFAPGGGGGGTFVVGPGNTPLVIAGGGGGGGGRVGGGLPGGGGLTGPDGGAGIGLANGGSGGNGGGHGTVGGGGGGGGFFSAGGADFTTGSGGREFPDLTGGSRGGGFGGGGGASGGAGGGGGYSGGGGGGRANTGSGSGGGGGSFDAGKNQIRIADLQTGNGEVVITRIVPVFAGKPGKANCQGKSVSALAQQYGGLNAAAEALGYPSVQALQDDIAEFCEG
jgi:hypothetical protein